MNKVILIGRLTKDAEVRTSQDGSNVARYTVAVDRMKKDSGADFIQCVAFGKSAEFAQKYLKKGIKIAIVGHMQTGSYKNKDGQTVYTTDVIVESSEFAESKKESAPAADDGFMSIPEGADDAFLPFN